MSGKPSAQSGSPQWFEHRKRFLIEAVKAVDSFSAAESSFRKLVEFGTTADADLRSALHTAGVINYARPFSDNFSGKGRQRTSFPKNSVKGHPSFDDDIHRQLILLRNKLIAHSDGDYADSRVFRKF